MLVQLHRNNEFVCSWPTMLEDSFDEQLQVPCVSTCSTTSGRRETLSPQNEHTRDIAYLAEGYGHAEQDLGALHKQAVQDAGGSLSGQHPHKQAGEPLGGEGGEGALDAGQVGHQAGALHRHQRLKRLLLHLARASRLCANTADTSGIGKEAQAWLSNFHSGTRSICVGPLPVKDEASKQQA